MSDNLDAPLATEDATTDAPELSEDVSQTPEMVEMEVSKFFGYRPGDPIDNADHDYMHTIWNYYAENAKSSGEVIRRISEAERGIAPPQPGETRLGKFYTYVRLLEESKSVKDELTAYKR